MPSSNVGIRYDIEADNSQFLAAMQQVQRAHQAAATDMAKSFQTQAERAASTVRAFLNTVGNAADQVSRSIGQAASQTMSQTRGIVEGTFNAVPDLAREAALGIIGAFGGIVGRMGTIAFQAFEYPISQSLGAAERRVAQWILDNQNLLSGFSANVESFFGLPSGADRRGNMDRDATQTLERRAMGTDLAGFLDQLREATKQDELLTRQIEARIAAQEQMTQGTAAAAGAVTRLRIEFDLLKTVWARMTPEQRQATDGLQQFLATLTEAQRATLQRDSELRVAAADRADQRGRDLDDLRRYQQTVNGIVSSIERQTDMARAQAESVLQTAGQRFIATAMAQAEARGSGRGANAMDDPRVQEKLRRGAEEADISATIKFPNELKRTMDEQTDSLFAQARALGTSAGRTAELTFSMQRLHEAQRAGVPITAELRQHIEQMAQSWGRSAQAIAESQDKLRQFQEIARSAASSLEQAFTKWLDGAKLSWRSFFNDLAKDIARITLRQQLQGVFGGGTANPAGLLGNLVAGFGGFRAAGGPLESGKWYIAGEKGPEPVWGGGSGAFAAGYGSGPAGRVPVNMTHVIKIEGMFGREEVGAIIRREVIAGTQAAVAASSEGFPARQRQLQMLGS